MNNTYIQRALTYSLIVSIIAAVFKLMHWQGANILLLTGLSSLAVAAFIQGMLEKNLRSGLRGAVIAAISISILFKLMHWPNGELMTRVSLAVGIVWYVYFNFIAPRKAE